MPYVLKFLFICCSSKKTVVISLWNDLATKEGEKLLDMVNESPVVLIKGLRVSDFQGMPCSHSLLVLEVSIMNLFYMFIHPGVSLSTTPRSVVYINPNITEANNLRSWYTISI